MEPAGLKHRECRICRRPFGDTALEAVEPQPYEPRACTRCAAAAAAAAIRLTARPYLFGYRATWTHAFLPGKLTPEPPDRAAVAAAEGSRAHVR